MALSDQELGAKVRAAVLRRNELRASVVAFMEAKAAALSPAVNREAPDWDAYEASEVELARVLDLAAQ